MSFRFIHPALFVALFAAGIARADAAEISFASWNVENLFDDVRDTRYDDELLEWWTTQAPSRRGDSA